MKTQLTKRILGIVLCLAMLMTYIPTVILAAEGDVASVTTAVGTQTYADLASAFAAAAQAENSVLTLLADTATSSSVYVDGGKFTVDLNGKTWTSNGYALVITGADMLITDSTADGQGKIVGTGAYIIMLGDGTKLEIAGGTVENTADFCIDTQYNGHPTDAQFTLSGGKLITAGWSAIKVGCASVTIKGGKIETQGDGEFHGDDHNYYSGLLDFSQHPDPTGIAVINCAGVEIIPGDTTIKLPAGYCFYEQRGNQPVAALPADDYVSCIIGKAPVCTCEEKCGTDSINSACALCSADITACTGQEAASENTLYFNNNVGWDQVYIYYWKNADALVTWPGVLMTQVEENIYAYDVPKDAEYVLFNNGSSSQTADQVVPTADKNCYDASADAWTTYGTPAVSAVTLYFKNTGNWDKVNVFYWYDDKQPISWPGVAMKQADDGIYYCDIPSDAKYVIFNNGNTQTHDLNAPANGKTLYDYSADTWYCYRHIFENGACSYCNIAGGYCGDASNTGGEYSVWWTFEDGVLTISGSGKMADYRMQTDLPYYSFASQVTTAVVEEGVTHLGKTAFGYGFVNLTEVTLPESMESIGAFAFWNTGITGIQLPEKLTKIDESTFAGCTYLQTITIPNNVLSVEYGAFEGSGLKKIHIPGNVKTIGQYAFSNSALKQVTIAEGVETIGESAFYRTPLTSIVIPKSVTQIADYALGMCEDLTKITFHCSDVYIGPNVFQRYGSSARTVSVPCYAEPLQRTLQDRDDLWDATFAYHHSPNEDGYVTTQNEHYYTCLECGQSITEAHDIADEGICECGLQAQAKIGNTYYLTLAQAAQAIAAGSNTIDVLTDVTIGADETLTFVGYAKLNVAEGKAITCNGTVKIGEAEGIIFENTLYYYGGDITNGGGGHGTLIYDFSRHIYYKAGNGYMLVIPATDTKTAALELHNANCTDQRGAQDEESLIGAKEALTIRFYGNNTLTCLGGYIDGAVLRTENSVTMIGMDAGATLTMQGGSENGGSALYGIEIKKGDLVIQSGTVTIRSGDGGNSCCGANIAGNLTVAPGAVLNVDGGESIYDLYWGLNAQAIEAEGTINGLVSYESGIEGLRVYGSTVLKHDLTTFFEAAQIAFPFAVPSGTTLTVNEGVTLDLSKLEVEDIDFSGTVINHGTILLPADFTLQNAPKGGTIKIGENSYAWDTENNKWIHSAGTSHLMDPATGKCVCGLEMAAAYISADGTATYYKTLAEALQNTKDAATLRLYQDGSVKYMTVRNGMTLDLNGCTLTADYFTVYGTVVDGKMGGNGLVIATKGIHVASNNPYLPIYDTTAGGYRFYQYQLQNLGYKTVEGAANTLKVGFRILLSNPAGYNVMSKTTDPKLDLVAHISWTGSLGNVQYTFSADTLRNYASLVYADITQTGTTNKAIALTIKGVDTLGQGAVLTAQPVVNCVPGTVASGETSTWTVP